MTSDTSQPFRGPAAEREVRELGPLLERVQPLTTTPRDALIDLTRLVRAEFRCILKNERAVVFDFRPEVGSLVAGK